MRIPIPGTTAASGCWRPSRRTLEVGGVSGTVTRALLCWSGIDIGWPTQGFTGSDADHDRDLQSDLIFTDGFR